MRTLAAFIKKEFHHIFRDPRTMIILFGIPAAQLLLFGFVLTMNIEDVNMAVLDRSNDAVTARLTKKIVSSGYFNLDTVLHSKEDIHRAFKKNRISQVVVYEPDFAQNLARFNHADLQIIADASDPNRARLLSAYTQGIVRMFMMQEAGRQEDSGIVPRMRVAFNAEQKSVYMFVPGIVGLILMLICAMMTSISITREKEQGSMEAILVSPLRSSQIIIGKVLPYMVLAFADAVCIFALGGAVFSVPVRGSLMLLMAETTLYIATALSLGIFISTVASSQMVAMMISAAGLMLPTILLSGFIFPISNMPAALQVLSNIVPAKWFLIIIKSIMLKGAGIAFFWKETLILAGMCGALLMVGVKRLNMFLE